MITEYNKSIQMKVPFTCLMKAPCGFGKSETSIKLIVDLKVKTVIIVKTKLLVTHWMSYFEKYKIDYNGSLFGSTELLVKMPDKLITPDVLIVVSRHLENPNFIKFLENNYSLCIIDEIHLWNLSSTSEVSKFILLHPMPITVYLTATPNMHTDSIFYGTVFYGERDSNIDNINRYIVDYSKVDTTTIPSTIEYDPESLCSVEKDMLRNRIIVSCIMENIAKNSVTFCNRRNHMELLYNLLNVSIKIILKQENTPISNLQEDEVSMSFNLGVKPIIILKGDAEFQKIHQKINNLSTANHFAMITTSHLCATGVNLPSINTVMIAAPALNETDIQQAVGRAERGPYNTDRYTYLFYANSTPDPQKQMKLKGNYNTTYQPYIKKVLSMKKTLIDLGWRIKK